MASVRKGREGDLGTRPCAREKEGEEWVPLPPSSHALCAFHASKILFPFPLERLPRRLDYLTNSGKKWNVCTRNIKILVKPSHYVIVVCFNVWLKLSIKDNVLLNSMYKSCPLFVLLTKIKLRMPIQSLNIDLCNAAICRLSCSSEFMKKELPSENRRNRRRGGREVGKGTLQSFGNFNHPCSAVCVYPVLDTHTSSYRKLSYAGPSQ